jgi:hypothetical protein
MIHPPSRINMDKSTWVYYFCLITGEEIRTPYAYSDQVNFRRQCPNCDSWLTAMKQEGGPFHPLDLVWYQCCECGLCDASLDDWKGTPTGTHHDTW